MLARIRDSAFVQANPRLAALLRNAGVLITGNALNGVLSLVYLAIITRALGLELFGVYGLYIAYVAILNRLVSFQIWQALIAYGAPAHEKGDRGLLADLLALGWLLDIASGIVGYAVALLGAVLVPAWFGLGEDALPQVALVALMLLFNWRSVPTALLRIYDSFMPQALFANLTSALQLVAVSILYWQGEDRLLAYFAVTTANNIIGQLGYFAYGYLRARKAGLFAGWRRSLGTLSARCPGLIRFALSTNGDGLVRVLRDLDIFIVNALLGVAAAGLYRIARILARAMGQLTGPFFQTIYPELARLNANAEHRHMLKLMGQSAAILGGMTFVAWAGFLLLGEWFLGAFFGPEFADAYAVAAWCIGAMVVWGTTHSLSPAMMAWHKADAALKINFITTCAYALTLYYLTLTLGLVGAGIALFLFYVLWGLVMGTAVARQWRLEVASAT